MTQAQKDAAALADHGVTAAQSAVETTSSSSELSPGLPPHPGDEYQRWLRDPPLKDDSHEKLFHAF